MVPVPGRSFLQHHIRPRPDLYGPFWVCVTLVFSIAISGNFADFLQKSVDPEQEVKWHYDLHKVATETPLDDVRVKPILSIYLIHGC